MTLDPATSPALSPIGVPGLHLGIPCEAYHAGPGVSKSALDRMAQSPAHYKEHVQHGREETPAMKLGNVIHCAVLQPELFDATYAVAPDVDRRTKAGKEAYAAFMAENVGKIFISQDDRDMAERMRDAVWSHPAAKNLMTIKGQVEASCWAKDEPTGLLRKCRPDKLLREFGVVVDLKTTEDASPGKFAKSCADYRYHVQAAYYLDTLALAGIEVDAFILVAVEKKPPYAVGVFQLEPEDVDLGRRAYRRDLDRLKACMEADHWPAYTEQIERIALPAWARKQEEMRG